MEEQRIAKTHKLVVNNRKTSMVTGVLDVLSFDLNEVLLEDRAGNAYGQGDGSACQPAECGKRRSGSVGKYRQYCVFQQHSGRGGRARISCPSCLSRRRYDTRDRKGS